MCLCILFHLDIYINPYFPWLKLKLASTMNKKTEFKEKKVVVEVRP